LRLSHEGVEEEPLFELGDAQDLIGRPVVEHRGVVRDRGIEELRGPERTLGLVPDVALGPIDGGGALVDPRIDVCEDAGAVLVAQSENVAREPLLAGALLGPHPECLAAVACVDEPLFVVQLRVSRGSQTHFQYGILFFFFCFFFCGSSSTA